MSAWDFSENEDVASTRFPVVTSIRRPVVKKTGTLRINNTTHVVFEYGRPAKVLWNQGSGDPSELKNKAEEHLNMCGWRVALSVPEYESDGSFTSVVVPQENRSLVW